MSQKILIVDDEVEIADLVELYLKSEGYTVRKFYSGREALDCVNSEELDLAILDVMLPDMDGFTLCARIREEHFWPIIMLTAKVEDMDKIMGLTIGADDYITKPFNPLELMARVKTQLRRYTRYNQAEAAPQKLPDTERDIRGLVINRETHKCTLYGKPVQLTPIEYNILHLLMRNPNRVFSSTQIYELVWNENAFGSESAVAVHIRHLREKIEINPSEPRYIKVVWGQGYKMEGKK